MPEPHVIHDRREGEGGGKNEEEEEVRAEGVAESRKVLVSWNKLLPASARERNKFSPEISPRLSRVPLPRPSICTCKIQRTYGAGKLFAPPGTAHRPRGSGGGKRRPREAGESAQERGTLN